MKHARTSLALSLALGSLAAGIALPEPPLFAPCKPEPGTYSLGNGLFLSICDSYIVSSVDGSLVGIVIGTLDPKCHANIIHDANGTIAAVHCSFKPACSSRNCEQVDEGSTPSGDRRLGCKCKASP